MGSQLANGVGMPRNAGLDYLRALAICVVLANHGFFVFLLDTGKVSWAGLPAYLSASAVVSIEWLFVLSGYLIGTMMIRSFEKPGTWRQRTRDFWLRRWFRTVPNYYLFLLVNAALVYFGVATGSFHWTFLVFSQNLYAAEAQPHFFGESWSLALDEWFYVAMPLLLGLTLWAFKAGLRAAFVATAVVLIVVPTCARALHGVPADFFVWDAEIRRVTIYHLDATGWGVLAAAANRWYKPWWGSQREWRATIGLVATLVGLAMVWRFVDGDLGPSFSGWFMNVFALTLMGLGTFLFMPWLTHCQIGRNIFSGFVDRTSLYSYSIYLCHFPLLFIVSAGFDLRSGVDSMRLMLAAAIWLISVYAVSALVFHLFEKPVSDLREIYTKKISSMPF